VVLQLDLMALDPLRVRLPEALELVVRPGLVGREADAVERQDLGADRKSTRLNSSHVSSSYAVFCLKKKNRIRAGPPISDLLALTGRHGGRLGLPGAVRTHHTRPGLGGRLDRRCADLRFAASHLPAS